MPSFNPLAFLESPPITSYEVISQNKQHLRLEGPTTGARMTSGAASAFSGVFAAVGLAMLKNPLPLPMRIVPIAFGAFGAGMAALEASKTVMSCAIDVKPKGVTLTWRWRPLPERTLEVPAKEIEELEIVSHEVGKRSEVTAIIYQRTLVKKDGTALPLESFGTKAQANLRKKAIEAIARR